MILLRCLHNDGSSSFFTRTTRTLIFTSQPQKTPDWPGFT